jgi:hypothetical protein
VLKIIPFQGFEVTCVMSTFPTPESPEDQMSVAGSEAKAQATLKNCVTEDSFEGSFDEDTAIDFEIPGTPEYEYL